MEHCGTKLPLVILNFLINFNRHTPSISQDSNPGSPKHKTSKPVPHITALSYKDSISPNLQHHRTGSLSSSLQHTLQSTTLYTDCLSELLTLLLSGATIDSVLEQNFWSGHHHQDRYLYHLAQSQGPHVQEKP